MTSSLIFITSGIVDYLFFTSLMAAILIIIAWGIIKLGKIRAPVYHYLIWLCALIAVLVLPPTWLYGPKIPIALLPNQTHSEIAITQQTNPQPAALLAEYAPFETQSPEQSTATLSMENPENPKPSIPMKTILSCLWFAGFLFMLTRLLIGWYRTKRLVQNAESVSDPLTELNISTHGGKVLLSKHVDSPMYFGFFRPVILFPEHIFESNTAEDLQMALSHELAHIERKDCWVNLFQRLTEAFLFFHPFVWYASSQITRNREQICDHYVISKGASLRNYADLLSRIVEHGLERKNLYAIALFEGKLLLRVKALLDSGNRFQIKASRRAVLTGAMVILLCMASGAIRLEAKSNNADVTKSVNTIQEEETFRSQEETLGPEGRRPTGNCSIGGKVVSAETGEPIEDARVYLFYTKTHDPIFIMTASDGSFVFRNIPTGPFALEACNVSGFQDEKYSPEDNAYGQSSFFSLNESENRTGIIFRLKPDYSISGKVLAQDGKPINDNQIMVFAYAESEKEDVNLMYTIVGQTDVSEDGSYLMDGLDGRPIYVIVTDHSSAEKDHPLPPNYYPGTVSREDAKMIYFDNGNFVEDVDIQLSERGEYNLEGFVTDKNTGNPVPKTLLTVHHSDIFFANTTTYTDEKGYYHIDTLGPGDFLIHVDAEPWGYVRTRKPFNIREDKTIRLDFTLTPAAMISGRFIDEEGEPVDVIFSAHGYSYTIKYPSSADGASGSWTGTTNKYTVKSSEEFNSHNSFKYGDGDYNSANMLFPTTDTFIIQGILPGNTTLNFYIKEEAREVKKILYNGREITGNPIETAPGEQIEGVSIVIGPVNTAESVGQNNSAENFVLRNYIRASLALQYDPLFKDLNLSSENLEIFKDLLADKSMIYSNLSPEIQKATTEEQKAKLQQRYASLMNMKPRLGNC